MNAKWSKVLRRTFKGSYLSRWHVNNRLIDHLFLLLCPQLSSPLPSLDIKEKKKPSINPFLDHLPLYHYYHFFFSHSWDFNFAPSVWSPPLLSREGAKWKSWPGDAVPSPAYCVLHQPGFPPAAAGTAGRGASRQEQVGRAANFVLALRRATGFWLAGSDP